MTNTNPPPTHEDYADEAQAAQRAEAWPQAAALWRRAADMLRAVAPHTTETFDLYAKYQEAAARCDDRDHVNTILEDIAKRELRIPTLRERASDQLDFHQLSVVALKRALWAAYEAGRRDAK